MNKPKTTVATARVETPEAHRDVVAAVSYRADGTPDQTKDFVVIGEGEARPEGEAKAREDD